MEDTSIEEPWLQRFAPKTFTDFYGYDSHIKTASEWIQCFQPDSKNKPEKNALLITGHPGTGKTAFAYCLVDTYGFMRMETTAFDSRTSQDIKNKLEHVLGEDSITVMTKKPKKTAVIMDELDGSDKQECPIKDIQYYINYAKHDYEYRWRVHLRTTKKKVSEAEIKKKLKETHFSNKNPIILIADGINYILKSILKDVIHIHFDLPCESQLIHTMSRINTRIGSPLSPCVMRAIVPFCQQDYRRAIHIMNDIWNRFYEDGNGVVDEESLIGFIKAISPKDIEIPIETMLDVFYTERDHTIAELHNFQQSEEEYFPVLVYENYITELERQYPQVSYKDKLTNAMEAYRWILEGAQLRHNEFGKDDIKTYSGYMSSSALYVCFNKLDQSARVINATNNDVEDRYIMDKSKISSKYKYRFCQYRPLYNLTRKLGISINEIPIISHMVSNAFFIQTDKKAYFMEFLSKAQLSYEEVEKLFRSSIYFVQCIYQLYTKKKEKDIETEYEGYMKKNRVGYIDDDDI